MTEKRLRILKELYNEKMLKNKLKKCDTTSICTLCECAINVINGNVPVNIGRLIPHEKELKTICKNSTSLKIKRKILSSAQGLKLLDTLVPACINYLEK